MRGLIVLAGFLSAASGAMGAQFANSSFEAPNVGGNNWLVRPPVGQTVWLFERNSGIANGASTWGYYPHTGRQYAFLQGAGNNGKISQTAQGFTPGREYRVRFWMMGRGNHTFAPLRLVKDGTEVIMPYTIPAMPYMLEYASQWFTATSEAHAFSFEAFDTTVDMASSIDDVWIEEGPKPPPAALENGNFEAPVFNLADWAYLPNGAFGLGWSFGLQAGLSNNKSTWGQTAADGSQFGFVQRFGSIRQISADFDPSAYYHLEFAMAARGNVGNTVRVLLDGTDLVSPITSNGQTWVPYASPSFLSTSEAHDLSFEGQSEADRTSLLDSVRFIKDVVGVPESLKIDRGRLVSGTLASLILSDDDYLIVQRGLTVNPGEEPVMVTVESTLALLAPRYLSISWETSADLTGLRQLVEAYNHVSGTWSLLAIEPLTTGDRRLNSVFLTNAARFVDPLAGKVKFRITVGQVGIVLHPNWRLRIDHVFWAASP